VSRDIRSIFSSSHSLDSPLFLTHAGDQSGRLFIVGQPGTIRILERGKLLEVPFLDIRDRVLSGGERGLLGLAFHPEYRQNGRFFVNYTRKEDGATVIAEYHRSDQADHAAREERVLVLILQPYPNHNGGMIAFGPDGYLYIGMGDGGAGGDPQNRAQNKDELLGKLLRIDVNGPVPYGIPEDNPYVRGEERPEIFAKGLRNPWRFSFDRETGDLWLADVGEKGWEEVNVVRKGENYGWRSLEGFHCFNLQEPCRKENFTSPVLEYNHQGGRCSIIGGYVYRGRTIPALVGAYLYGDYCSGEIFAVRTVQGGRIAGDPWLLLKTNARISSFGEDDTGEIYMLDLKGTVYLLAPGSK
ncbi:MAG TPA: PQQ-dependent sugar dehydrogenase, partial [Nitrospiraceae bacterium]|nr:PQQ-dependent sugar dehydrogenase [Nitrospiraceae bacterium]